MQKTSLLMALTATALASASLPSRAQSSVVVFGIMDAAVRNVSNEGRSSVWSQVSGSNSTSRLGFRGTEDLGGGMSAGFHLEHGLLLDSGTPASNVLFWDRRATVSLAGKSWGEIRAGRDFVPTYVNWSRYDPFSYVGAAGSNNLISATPVGPIRSAFGSALNTTVRSSNSVQYLLPADIGGLEGGLMVAAGEGGTAANGQHKLVAGRLGYAAKAWGVSAAHTRTQNDLTGPGKLRDTAIAGNATLAGAKLGLVWREFKLSQAKQTHWLFGASVPVGESGEFKASLQRVNFEGQVGTTRIAANDATQLGLGYVHSLSKRSVLYGTASRINNQGVATFVVPGGAAAIAGKRSTGIEFGVRHTF